MYKHIFDYFDKNGKYVGGCEPLTDSTDRPMYRTVYYNPCFVIYVGWCYENDDIYSGCYFSDCTEYNKETKQLTPIYEPNETIFGKVKKISEYLPSDMTLEKCCEFKGVELPENYVKYKEAKQQNFINEYQKCKDDAEYFKNTYYKMVKKLS